METEEERDAAVVKKLVMQLRELDRAMTTSTTAGSVCSDADAFGAYIADVNQQMRHLRMLELAREEKMKREVVEKELDRRSIALATSIEILFPPLASFEVNVGEELQLSAVLKDIRSIVIPRSTVRPLAIWKSSDMNIANVDAKLGLVKGAAQGRAVITAKAGSVSTTVTVNVP